MDAFDLTRIARIRASLATAGFSTEGDEEQGTFEALIPADNTRLEVTCRNGVTTVARVMPSGHISANVVFSGMPSDVVVDAVVAMARSLEA